MWKRLKNALRTWLGIAKIEGIIASNEACTKSNIAELRSDIKDNVSNIQSLQRLMTEYFKVDVDMGHRSNNTIVLTGIYRGKGYVQFYDVGDGEFLHMVERMRDMHKHNLIRNVDAPPSFRGTFRIR